MPETQTYFKYFYPNTSNRDSWNFRDMRSEISILGWCRHRRRCLNIVQMSSNSNLVSVALSLCVFCCVTQFSYCHGTHAVRPPATTKDSENRTNHAFFLQRIFTDYGTNGTMMTFEGFEHLLARLGFIIITDHELEDHKQDQKFLDKHLDHEHPKGNTNEHSKDGSSSHEHHEQSEDDSEDDHHSESDYPHDLSSQGLKTTKSPPSSNLPMLMELYRELSFRELGTRTQCPSPKEIYMSFNMDLRMSIDPITFLIICPAIIFELDQCHQYKPAYEPLKTVSLDQWLYAVLAVILISLCGLFSVAVIPIMQKWFYHTLLQFLVGLAIGSLSGDALLHLLPHAMIGGDEDGHHHDEDHAGKEAQAVWMGLCALSGIYIFFIMERVLSAISTYRRQNKTKRMQLGADTAMIPYSSENTEANGNVGEKLSQYRKNSYNSQISPDAKEAVQMLPDPEANGGTNSRRGSRRSSHEVAFHGRSSFSTDSVSGVLYNPTEVDPEKFTVTVSEHHGHGHGHSHEVPDSVSAVALMVIMGDGLHNFCDGIAIGAAFATSVGDGISTTVAVFCHELPHELGDFAMLLKTGMKVKQALMYNLLSSVLCLIGMAIGVSLGSVSSATMWIFAGTAGMFLYIALVDMLPELVTTADDPRTTISFTLAIQVLGITIGVCIMLLIALFEDTLKSIVS